MSEQPGRYTRSSSGLVGALLVLIALIGGYVVLQSVLGNREASPVPAVDYGPVVEQARAQHALLVAAPDRLPRGWKATSVGYQNGRSPTWHLGLLTDRQKYVGIEESLETERQLVTRVLDGDPSAGSTVRIDGQVWRVWTAGSDYALVRRTPAETLLVGGSAGEDAVRELVGRLSYGTVREGS